MNTEAYRLTSTRSTLIASVFTLAASPNICAGSIGACGEDFSDLRLMGAETLVGYAEVWSATSALPALYECDESQRICTPASEHQSLVSALKAHLQQYKELHPDWDFDGAAVPTTLAINMAERLLDYFPDSIPLPEPMISSDGVVGFYWKGGVCFADIEIEGSGDISLFTRLMATGNETFEEFKAADHSLAVRLAERLKQLFAEAHDKPVSSLF